MEKQQKNTEKRSGQTLTHPRPPWVPENILDEQELCPDCFKVVGDKNRYTLVCALGKSNHGASVSELTNLLNLTQPTITHHLQILVSVGAIARQRNGRKQIYSLNRNAHCFKECKIPY